MDGSAPAQEAKKKTMPMHGHHLNHPPSFFFFPLHSFPFFFFFLFFSHPLSFSHVNVLSICHQPY